MMSTFYQALIEAQTWFFGDTIMQDAFFSTLIQLFNSGILIAMFYSVLVYPLKMCVRFLISHFKGV